MKHRLPGAASVVEHGPVAFDELSIFRKLCGDELQPTEQGCVLRGGVGQRNEMPARADEYVAGRLGMDVLEGENFLVLVDHFGWDFFFSDFAEQAVVHEGYPELRVYS